MTDAPLSLASVFQPGFADALTRLSDPATLAAQPVLAATIGDGVADDAPAIMAALAAVRGIGRGVTLPGGLHRILSPVLLTGPTAWEAANSQVGVQDGFILEGAGGPAAQAQAGRGTMIQAGAPGLDLLQIGEYGPITSALRNIALDGGDASLGTKCGLHTLYGHFSHLLLLTVRIGNVDWAVWIDNALGGGNGEFVSLVNCNLGGRLGCYKNTSPSGQARGHSLVQCHGGTDNGGTQFWLGPDNIGFGVSHWSSTQGNGPLANTLLHLDGTSGPVVWDGFGIQENVDTLASMSGGSTNLAADVSISGQTFTGMPAAGHPLFSGGGTGCSHKFKVAMCSFSTNNPAPAALSLDLTTGGSEQIIFEDCRFSGWGDYSALVRHPQVTMIRCLWRDNEGNQPWLPLTS